jgi:Domain of unknown function (DUF4388)
MRLAGYLSEYSLPEVFQQIHREDLTGMLKIETEEDSVKLPHGSHYLWFKSGRLLAMARNLDRTSLLLMLEQRRWITATQIQKILTDTQKLEHSLGEHLKSEGILSSEQLQVIFHAQILQPVCSLFKIQTASFSFNPKTKLAKAEMTGLSVSANEASLLGLRVLRDWLQLTDKLPQPQYSLTKTSQALPTYKLDMQELQIWELANGKKSIAEMAEKLGIELDSALKIAFRLKMVGLVEESQIANKPDSIIKEEVVKKEESKTSIWLKQIDTEAMMIGMSGLLKSVKNRD